MHKLTSVLHFYMHQKNYMKNRNENGITSDLFTFFVRYHTLVLLTWSFCCFHICLQHSLTHPGSASTPSTPRMTCHALPFSLCMALEMIATNKCSLSALFIVGRMQWFYYAYAFCLSDQVSFWHASHGISSYFWHARPLFVYQSCELSPPHTRMQLLAASSGL